MSQSIKRRIELEGELRIWTDYLAGGTFYNLLIGDTNVREEIFEQWFGFQDWDMPPDLPHPLPVGRCRLVIEELGDG